MMKEKPVIALVAHDGRKMKLLEWVRNNWEELQQFELVGTKGTAKRISQIIGLKVKSLGHGPHGGDIAIAHNVSEKNIDAMIFFIDTEPAHGHQAEIETLIRTCITEKIPFALNMVTADCVLRYLLKLLKLK